MSRVILFIFLFALIGTFIGKWIYLLFKKFKIKEEQKWVKINEQLEKESKKKHP